MSKRKEKPKFEIVPIEELPKAKKLRETIYDEVVKEILKQPKGFYKISIEEKKSSSVYSALAKRITERKLPLKIHARSKEVYLEKLS
jgi:prophage antirepressor-like protein